MDADYEYMDVYSRRFIARANRLGEAGDKPRADAWGAVGSAMQLFPARAEALRGEYFGPMMSGGFGEMPNMAFVRSPEVVAFLRQRMRRIGHDLRRARVADAVWEFSEKPDADAARVAAAAYLAAGRRQLTTSAEFASMSAAGALGRALWLGRVINDRPLIQRILDAMADTIRYLAARDDHAALFNVVKAMLRGRDAGNLSAAEDALGEHLARLRGRDDDNFHFQQGILDLQTELARRRRDETRVAQLQRDMGESIAAEAAWKGAHYPNGGLVAMTFYAQAAEHFERLGDAARAAELHALERQAFDGAQFISHQVKVTVDLKPFRDWLAKIMEREHGAETLWPSMLRGLPVPALDRIAELDKEHAKTLMSRFGVSSVRPEGVLESVSPEEASRRWVRRVEYQRFGGDVATLMRLAAEAHGVKAQSAAASLSSTGLFDATSTVLLDSMLTAVDAAKWVSAAYLAGPLFERLVRALAVREQLDVMHTVRRPGGTRRERRAVEDLLMRLGMNENVRAYVQWVLAFPGLNLRNDTAHGILEADACNEGLAAHITYALLALAFGDFLAAAVDKPGADGEPPAED